MRPLLLVLALAGCAGVRVPERESRAAPARAADDQALADSAADLATFEDHFIAVAGGRFLGGAMLREDAANLLAGVPGADAHAYLFLQGSQGERRVAMPALYGPRVAGNGLLAALGLKAAFDPTTGELTLTSGDRRRAFTSADGSAVAWFTVEPASGLGAPVDVEFVVASGFAGTALVAGVDADAAGLVLSEIPGVAQVTELMTGRVVPCRRALARVTLVGFDGEPDARVSALVEVLFPK
jgi:hypothetical protein